MLQSTDQQTLEGIPAPSGKPEPKRKERTRKKGHVRKAPPQPTLGIVPAGAEHNEDTGERFTPDCNGAPGICLFMRCRWNLILEVIPCVHCGGRGKFAGRDCNACQPGGKGESGGVSVNAPPRPKPKKGEPQPPSFVTIPLHRSNDHVMKRGDIEQAGDMAADAAEYLEQHWGSTCAWDLIQQAEPMQLTDIGKVLRVSRERARQICEEGARRTRSAYDRELEPHKPQAQVLVQIRRKERP